MGSVLEGIPALLPTNVGPAFSSAYGQARQQGLQQQQVNQQGQQINFQQAQQVDAIVSKGAELADTPEKWKAYVGVLQKNFPQADLSGFQDFSARSGLLDPAFELQKQQIAQAQSNADRSFNLQAATAGVPAGYRKTADGGLEPIPGGPAANAGIPAGYRKTPDGNLEAIPGGPAAVAAEAAANGRVPSGYRVKPDGTFEPVPGGPADPNTSNAFALTSDALDIIASQYLAGDKSAITGYARNAQMRAQIANAVATKANDLGMDGKAIAAEISAYGGNVTAQKSAGTRAAQVGMAASEASQMADIALDASKNVPRNAIVPYNQLTNAVRSGTSSPEMAAFTAATTSLVNAYARAVSPLGAPTDAMRQHAEAMLNTAQSPEAYAAVIAQMKKEMVAALNAPSEISSSLKTAVSGQPAQAAPGQGPQADPAASAPAPASGGVIDFRDYFGNK